MSKLVESTTTTTATTATTATITTTASSSQKVVQMRMQKHNAQRKMKSKHTKSRGTNADNEPTPQEHTKKVKNSYSEEIILGDFSLSKLKSRIMFHNPF